MRALLIALLGLLAAAAAAAPPIVQRWDDTYLSLRKGVTVQAALHFTVASGYYLAGGGPGSGLTPLRLRMTPATGVKIGNSLYPTPTSHRIGSQSRALPAYRGTFAIRVPITVAADARWDSRTLRGTLTYQACTQSECLPVRSLPVGLQLEIRPAE
jgi:DsbC/DsbD-like thiol-disulfide interchange protein